MREREEARETSNMIQGQCKKMTNHTKPKQNKIVVNNVRTSADGSVCLARAKLITQSPQR